VNWDRIPKPRSAIALRAQSASGSLVDWSSFSSGLSFFSLEGCVLVSTSLFKVKRAESDKQPRCVCVSGRVQAACCVVSPSSRGEGLRHGDRSRRKRLKLQASSLLHPHKLQNQTKIKKRGMAAMAVVCGVFFSSIHHIWCRHQ